MQEKRQVGSVYCITKIDKYGKCENGFVPAVDLPLGDNTLGQELAAARQEIAELKKELAETKKKSWPSTRKRQKSPSRTS